MIEIISIALIIIGIASFIFGIFIMKTNKLKPIKRENNERYAILIPARDESRVIDGLLTSIDNQTRKINSKDVYVIVESMSDKTVDITRKHNMNIVLRHDLTKKRKGYALDDAVKEILSKNIRYDAYFIFDADNVLDKNYIKEMEKSINKGYDIGIGYRNTKNSNNLVSAASSLTFSMINTIANEMKVKYHNSLTISGTGYYIRGYLIEKWEGFIFHTLTEDYEFTLYSTFNDLTSTYNKKAIFYDEQPTSFIVSIKQRARWAKGYFQARCKYISNMYNENIIEGPNSSSKINEFIGIKPIISIIVGVLLFLINALITKPFNIFLKYLVVILLSIYIVLFAFTFIMIMKEKMHLNMSSKMRIKVIFYNPIFLASYLICVLVLLFDRNLGWDKIEHKKN